LPSRTLFEYGVFLRIRDSGKLDIKFNPDPEDIEHVVCQETRFSFPMGREEIEQLRGFLSQFGVSCEGRFGSLDDYFRAVGLGEWVRIAKRRKLYRREGVEFCVDDVDGLGRFVEIEVSDPAAADFYMSWATSQRLINLAVGYVELYLRKHDWETYLRGRYVMLEDRRE
jgi:hypothetical protein